MNVACFSKRIAFAPFRILSRPIRAKLNKKYNGQFLQDKYVHRHFFKNKKGGIFLEIGSHQPIKWNNTYFFEKHLNWTGLCIDPHPVMFEKIKNVRSAKCLNAAIVGSGSGTKQFLQLDKLSGFSGLIDNYKEEDKERIESASKISDEKQKIIKVQTLPINQVLEDYKLFHIDYLSLDIEGGELAILKAIDFNRFFIDVITVENNWEDIGSPVAKNSSIRKHMESVGYQYVEKLGVDEIYKRL